MLESVMSKKLFFLLVFLILSSTLFGEVINFDKDETGKAPKGFIFGLTGKGKPGDWVTQKDPTGPSAPNVLAQTNADPVSYRFPLCVYEGFTGSDVDISVKYKPMSG